MLNEPTLYYREVIQCATQLMSSYYQQSIQFSDIDQLSEPDRRNVVLRLHIANPATAIPPTVILKMNSTEKQVFERGESETEIDQLSRFAHDWAGIEFLTQVGNHHGPLFYAGSMEHKFILIEDLGFSHPSLVGPLTRESSNINIQEAEKALTLYMQRLGKMQADTFGKSTQFSTILKRIYPKALRFNFINEADSIQVKNQFKKLLGIESDNLTQEINQIIQFSQDSNEFNVFLHGDICPDNVYYRDNKIQFIDFEFGDFGNALIDAVYLRMCMPSCWCSKAIPDEIIHQMELVYRNELKTGILTAADDFIYNKQLIYACGYWLIRTLRQLQDMDLIDHEWICPSGPVDTDSKWDPGKNAFRPRILSRLSAFISCIALNDHLPNLREASVQLLAYLNKIWPETRPIDVFPVFQSRNHNEGRPRSW
jgi:thiamine kinase-like enzyme